MSILKKLAGQTALYGLSSIIGRLVTFVFLTPYLTARLVPSEMGVQTDLYAWAAFLMVIFSYRMETAFFRFGKDRLERPKAFRTAMTAVYTTTALLVGLLLLFAQPIATALEYDNHAIYIQYFALILGFDALAALPFARLRLEGKAKRFAIVKLANLFLHIFALLFLLEVLPYTDYYNAEDKVAYIFLANLIASASTLLLMLPQLSFKFWNTENKTFEKSIFDKALLQQMLFYAFPLVIAAFAGIINEVIDRVLLKNMLEGDLQSRLYQVGIYGACYKIAIFMNLFTQAFNYAAEPFFFKESNRKDARDLYADVTFIFGILGCLAFAGIGIFMDLAQYFVAPVYREGLDVVPILLLANLCLGLYYNVSIWYKLSDKTHYGTYIAFIGASVTILVNILLIPKLGYMGAAWATLACYVIMLILGYYWGQKFFPIPYKTARILIHIFAAIAVVFLYTEFSFFVKGSSVFINQIYNTLYFGIYAIIVLYFEKSNIKTMLKRQ